jgi:hypothetical protein
MIIRNSVKIILLIDKVVCLVIVINFSEGRLFKQTIVRFQRMQNILSFTKFKTNVCCPVVVTFQNFHLIRCGNRPH